MIISNFIIKQTCSRAMEKINCSSDLKKDKVFENAIRDILKKNFPILGFFEEGRVNQVDEYKVISVDVFYSQSHPEFKDKCKESTAEVNELESKIKIGKRTYAVKRDGNSMLIREVHSLINENKIMNDESVDEEDAKSYMGSDSLGDSRKTASPSDMQTQTDLHKIRSDSLIKLNSNPFKKRVEKDKMYIDIYRETIQAAGSHLLQEGHRLDVNGFTFHTNNMQEANVTIRETQNTFSIPALEGEFNLLESDGYLVKVQKKKMLVNGLFVVMKKMDLKKFDNSQEVEIVRGYPVEAEKGDLIYLSVKNTVRRIKKTLKQLSYNLRNMTALANGRKVIPILIIKDKFNPRRFNEYQLEELKREEKVIINFPYFLLNLISTNHTLFGEKVYQIKTLNYKLQELRLSNDERLSNLELRLKQINIRMDKIEKSVQEQFKGLNESVENL